MIEIRNGGPLVGELISKGCKQVNACVNNNNNPNTHNCCCTGNNCNKNGTTCANDNIKPGMANSVFSFLTTSSVTSAFD